MDLETAQTTTTAKFPILKQGEYDMWRLRIEQFFQVQDYALWDVIDNGNSFKPVAQTTTNADGTSTSLIRGPVTTKEKAQKKNDVKAETLFAAIQTRFGSNEATKKTLLKKMYENFSAPSTESLDSVFNRLQKIVSQLAILGENISQEDLNLKFLRSLPSEWNTHVVVWRNKPDLDIMSFDDLYNNFKIVEQEVKGTASSSSSLSSQNMAFVSSPSSTNEVNTAYGVITANTQVSHASTQLSTASTQVSTANLSDDTVYAFLASQPNGSQLVYEDLEQIHEDDIEEIDLKWQLALLSMRTRRGPRNQDSRNKNQDSSRRTVNVEETSSKAMVAIDGAGFDWSYMADDEVPTNMALIAFSDSEVHNDKTCSKTCLKSFETLKTQLDDLRIEFNKSKFNLATYKRGLAFVEEQLVFYKKNEVIFCEQLVVLKRDISYKDSEISMLKSELEKLKQEKESNQLKIKNFDNASKSLDKLIGSQIPDKSRKGVGFPEFEGNGPKTSKSVSEDISNEVRETFDSPLVKELVSDDKLEKKTIFPTVAKIEFVRPKQQEKPIRKPVKLTAITIKGKGWYLGIVIQGPVNTTHSKTTVYSARPISHFSKSAQLTVKRPKAVNIARPNSAVVNFVRENQGHPQKEDQGYVDSGCSRHMTRNMSYLSDFKEFDGGYVTFGGGAKGGKITGKGTLKTGDWAKQKPLLYLDSLLVAYGVADSRELWRVCIVKPHNKSPYELFRGRTPALSFMRPFGCHVTILNTLDYLGHGPKWLFDIDVLTQSMNYVPVVVGTNSNDLNASNDEPQPFSDAEKKDDEGVNTKSRIDDQERPKNSTQEVDMRNITTTYPVPSTLNTRIYKDHLLDHVIGDVQSSVKERRMTKTTNEQGFISVVYEGKTHKDLYTCLFACFLSQEEPKKVWTLVDLPHGKRAIGTKWVYRNKKDEREKALYGLHQAPRAWYETLSTYLLDNGFQRGQIDKTLFIKRVKSDILLVQVYVDDIIFGSTKKKLCTEFEKLMHKKFQMSSMGKLTFFLGLQVIHKDDGIFISQDKYVDEILKKFGFLTVKTASTPMETSKPLLKDAEAEDVDVPQPSSPSHTNVADEAASTRVDVRHGGATTTVSSLDAGHDSGNIDKTPSMPHDSPLPRGQTLGSDDGRMQHNELMDLVTKLSNIVGRKIAEIDQDPDISLVQDDTKFNFDFNAAKEVSTAKEDVSTTKSVTTAGAEISTASPEVKTAGDFVDDIAAESLVYIRRSAAKTKDKGKGIMEESESAMTKTKRQQEQERLGYEAVVRLQVKLEEEERQRIARVHKSASSFNVEEWEDIKARVEADEELA
ncbi:ribonuclease H-like domain-containing protein [Tanacetum coccineum]